MDPETLRNLRDHYYREMEATNAWLTDAGKGLNNLVLVVGTGSFVLSISFVTGVLEKLDLVWQWALILSWVLLAASIILLGWKYLLNQFVADRMQQLTNEWADTNYAGENAAHTDKKIKMWKELKKWMAIISLSFMTLGIIFLLMFGIANAINAANGYGHYDIKVNLDRVPGKPDPSIACVGIQ